MAAEVMQDVLVWIPYTGSDPAGGVISYYGSGRAGAVRATNEIWTQGLPTTGRAKPRVFLPAQAVLVKCWASIVNGGPASVQYNANVVANFARSLE